MYLQYVNVSYQMILSQVEAIFGCPQFFNNNTRRTITPFLARLVRIAIYPTVPLIMVVHHLHTTSATPKWIQFCTSLLVGTSAIYLTSVVLVECTVRVVLFKAGLINSVANTRMVSNPNHRCMLDRQRAELDRHIERSLRREKFDHETTKNDTATSPCCSICLEEFQPGETMVSGHRNCCKSNVFHEACIQQWLRINDSCPCCRKSMLVVEPADDENEAEACHEHKPPAQNAMASGNGSESDNNITNSDQEGGYIQRVFSQIRSVFDTTNLMRNEILSNYTEQQQAS